MHIYIYICIQTNILLYIISQRRLIIVNLMDHIYVGDKLHEVKHFSCKTTFQRDYVHISSHQITLLDICESTYYNTILWCIVFSFLIFL